MNKLALVLAPVLISLIILYRFGFTQLSIAALIFSGLLMALVYIDMQRQLLPDHLTLPLLWLGLLANTQHLFTDPASAIWGAVAGYLTLWIVAKLFYWCRGKIGMGNGDFKLLAAIGAWLGWQALLPILIISSTAGLIFGVVSLALKKITPDKAFAFGPFLALAAWSVLLWP